MQPIRRLEVSSIDLFRSIVDQAPDAMIYADRDGTIRVWNKAAEAIFGFTAADVLGSSLDVIVPERFRRAHWEAFDKAIQSGHARYGGRVMTTRSLHKNLSKLYVDMSFGLVKDSLGAVVGTLALARDCTERHLSKMADQLA